MKRFWLRGPPHRGGTVPLLGRSEDILRTVYKLRRNPLSVAGLSIIALMMLVAIFAPWIAPYPEDATAVHFDRTFRPPSFAHPFGTDEVGRDLLSRVILGSRISFVIGFAVLAVALGVGIPLGLIAGYVRGRVNAGIMRVTDIFLAVPPLAWALAVSALLPPTLENSILAISFGWWPWYVRLVQGQVLSIKEEDFVHSAEVLGAPARYVMFKEVFPSIVPILIVKVSLDLGFAILTGTLLGFLGLGVREPTPEWGTMIGFGREHLPDKWWLTTFPGFAIFSSVLGFNLVGDGLRDALDVELE